ncbi:hypothetical protein PR048_003698 [Dryococelus australis]|uniref:Uncharacterized protein n=1 Tax=Dryococelus australis TaxID=614101 RepID=A0ABQ9INR7_9NEOP|nr:hypothetical protein PR048_003698 [Dryococelus australis]
MGPCKTVQLVISRGILSKWKQPVIYDFDSPMTTAMLMRTISELEASGFPVYLVTRDMGGGNRSVMKSLGINYQNPSFVNPVDASGRVYVFADAPRLSKLARNHFLDKGYILRSGETVYKSTAQQLLDKPQGELKIAFKITQHHLDVSKTQRQKVQTAAQISSRSVSKALLYSGENSLISGDWKSTADFPYYKETGIRAYGVEEDLQNNILNEVDNVAGTMRGAGCKFELPFRNGILMKNNFLKNVFSDLKTKYNVRCLLTCKVNQDVLENVFFLHYRFW